MRKRFGKVFNVVVAVLYVCDIFGVYFRLFGNSRHSSNSFNGVSARRRLARKHNGGGAVVYCVGNVGNFRTRGAGLFYHRFQHFRRRNRAPAVYAALVYNGFLYCGQFFEGHFHAEVAARNHYAAALVDNAVKIVYARAALYFRNEFNLVVGVAALSQPISHLYKVLRLGYERAGDKVNALFNAEFQVGFVLSGKVLHFEFLVGEEHRFAVG